MVALQLNPDERAQCGIPRGYGGREVDDEVIPLVLIKQ